MNNRTQAALIFAGLLAATGAAVPVGSSAPPRKYPLCDRCRKILQPGKSGLCRVCREQSSIQEPQQ